MFVFVRAHAGFSFFFLHVHARSNVMFSSVKADILASPAPFGIPGEKTSDGRCCTLMATELSNHTKPLLQPDSMCVHTVIHTHTFTDPGADAHTCTYAHALKNSSLYPTVQLTKIKKLLQFSTNENKQIYPFTTKEMGRKK